MGCQGKTGCNRAIKSPCGFVLSPVVEAAMVRHHAWSSRTGRCTAATASSPRAPAGHEAAEADGDDGRLAAASKHDVRLALADVVGGRDEGVVGRRAGGGDAVVGPHEAVVDCHQRAAPAQPEQATVVTELRGATGSTWEGLRHKQQWSLGWPAAYRAPCCSAALCCTLPETAELHEWVSIQLTHSLSQG